MTAETLLTLFGVLGVPTLVTVVLNYYSNRMTLRRHTDQQTESVMDTYIARAQVMEERAAGLLVKRPAPTPQPVTQARWEVLADDVDTSIYDVIDARLEYEGLTESKPQLFQGRLAKRADTCPDCDYTDVRAGFTTIYSEPTRPCPKHCKVTTFGMRGRP